MNRSELRTLIREEIRKILMEKFDVNPKKIPFKVNDLMYVDPKLGYKNIDYSNPVKIKSIKRDDKRIGGGWLINIEQNGKTWQDIANISLFSKNNWRKK